MEKNTSYLEMAMDEPNTMADTWAFLLKYFGVAILPFTLLWHYIDQSFKNRKAERESMLKQVGEEAGKAGAKEVLNEFTKEWIMPMNTRMDKQDEAIQHLGERIDKYLDKK